LATLSSTSIRRHKQKWFGFVRRLKATFPDDETLGQRLAKFIDALNSGEIGAHFSLLQSEAWKWPIRHKRRFE